MNRPIRGLLLEIMMLSIFVLPAMGRTEGIPGHGRPQVYKGGLQVHGRGSGTQGQDWMVGPETLADNEQKVMGEIEIGGKAPPARKISFSFDPSRMKPPTKTVIIRIPRSPSLERVEVRGFKITGSREEIKTASSFVRGPDGQGRIIIDAEELKKYRVDHLVLKLRAKGSYTEAEGITYEPVVIPEILIEYRNDVVEEAPFDEPGEETPLQKTIRQLPPLIPEGSK